MQRNLVPSCSYSKLDGPLKIFCFSLKPCLLRKNLLAELEQLFSLLEDRNIFTLSQR